MCKNQIITRKSPIHNAKIEIRINKISNILQFNLPVLRLRLKALLFSEFKLHNFVSLFQDMPNSIN